MPKRVGSLNNLNHEHVMALTAGIAMAKAANDGDIINALRAQQRVAQAVNDMGREEYLHMVDELGRLHELVHEDTEHGTDQPLPTFDPEYVKKANLS